MRCPKCQYITFGPEKRCRNCGYDFSLSSETETLDLPIQDGSERIGPLTDLPLGAPSSRSRAVKAEAAADFEASTSRTPTRPDLPLFPVPASDDTPLVTPPAVPRAPLSVRRAAPIITRPRQQPTFEDEFASDEEGGSTRSGSSGSGVIAHAAGDDDAAGAAPPAGRMLAGLFDVSLMAAIDLAVIFLTLRLCNLDSGDVMLLPKLPMMAFFLLLNGGYLVLFTAAGGQTIGKMATGIKVVPQSVKPGMRVPFSTAVLRAAAFLASLLPAGLGLLPIVFSSDGRALHDRLSNTRVVRA